MIKFEQILKSGKHLVFQFKTFALRVHFLLFGTFTATIAEECVAGDYARKRREPRLALTFAKGHIELYSCSLKYIESAHAKEEYDFTLSVMSPQWDAKQALKSLQQRPHTEIADALLDQTLFAGVGNIIKNEVLFLTRVHPETQIQEIKLISLKKIVKTVTLFSHQFYVWRKAFELKKHLQVYHRKTCPHCDGEIQRAKTGVSDRWSFFCPLCQR